LTAAGIEVMRVDGSNDETVDLGAALRLLAARGITRVFCEGGRDLPMRSHATI
jgi:diaminohydroxyphosphoribosylaminopyrimidine deaminase/5-amino-6-(5-phosphoribosylamino)uracil reductase